MFYKEWLLARTKLKILAVVYAIGMFYVLMIWSVTAFMLKNVALGSSSDRLSGMFASWIGVGALIAFLSAILASTDAFSEETEKNTLSFIMSRPINRVAIFSTKVMAGMGVALIPYLVCGFLVSWFDLLFTTGSAKFFNNLSSLALSASVITLIVFIGILVSLFTRYTMMAFILTIVITVSGIVFSVWISNLLTEYKFTIDDVLTRTIVTLIIVLLNYLLYLLGRKIIILKQF